MGLSAGGAGGNVFDALPLLDVAEEMGQGISPNDQNPATGGMSLFRPARMTAGLIKPNDASGGGFFGASTGATTTRTHANGLVTHAITRVLGQNGRRSSDFGLPLCFNPFLAPQIPAVMRQGRRYVWECVAWRDALVAGSIFAVGVQTNNNNGAIVPSNAFGNYSSYYFRSLLAENGGLWQVAWRQGFGAAALNLVPTTFTATVPRRLRFECVTDPVTGIGTTLTLSIDGTAVQTFRTSSGIHFPVLAGGEAPWWGLSYGNEGAAVAGLDFCGLNRFQVFGV